MIKRVIESLKPKGINYIYSCGHSYFMTQQEVIDFVKQGSGPDAPKTCPTCEDA